MRSCPACSEEISDGRLRCEVCGELQITDEWRCFLERYDRASREERRELRDALPRERLEEFRRVREVWREAHPETRTTAILNPVPRAVLPPRSVVPLARRSFAVALLPLGFGLPVVFAVGGSRPGLAGVLGASLLGALVTARSGSSDLRTLASLTGWLAVSLAAALSLYPF